MQNFYLSALLVFLLDQLSKYYILSLPFSSIEILPFLAIVKTWNKGVAFGIGASSLISPLFTFLIPLLLLVLLIYARKTDKINKVFLGMIFGGGLGNWFDRVRFGAVLDFIDLHYKSWHWPAFNVADTAITLGLLFLIKRHVVKS